MPASTANPSPQITPAKPVPDIRLQYNRMLHENFKHVFMRTVDDEYYVRILVYRNIHYREIHPEAVPLFSFTLPADAPLYAEGYQMLSRIEGTGGAPVSAGRLSDDGDLHVLPAGTGEMLGFNYLVTRIGELWYLLGAVSCFETFISFRIHSGQVDVIWQMDGCLVAPCSEFLGEKVCLITSPSRDELMERYARMIAGCHGVRRSSPKSGWCSWYAYGAGVTGDQVIRAAELMRDQWPELEYVQIDDGYQTHMGDWLTPSDQFPGGLELLCSRIRDAGRKIGIWVAPFIASGSSAVFREHPDWFVCGRRKRPLAAGEVTYGGWRDGPWYMLDFSVSEVRDWIRSVFRHFRSLGIDYFKLDALYWGAVPCVRYRDRSMTVVRHYRLGLETVREGAGEGCFILGCNAPLWPSLGLVEAQRITDDVERSHGRIASNAAEAAARQWMSGRLWLNDPDCIVTTGVAPEDIDLQKRTAVSARGPLISGDPLDEASPRLREIAAAWRKAEHL